MHDCSTCVCMCVCLFVHSFVPIIIDYSWTCFASEHHAYKPDLLPTTLTKAQGYGKCFHAAVCFIPLRCGAGGALVTGGMSGFLVVICLTGKCWKSLNEERWEGSLYACWETFRKIFRYWEGSNNTENYKEGPNLAGSWKVVQILLRVESKVLILLVAEMKLLILQRAEKSSESYWELERRS